MSSSIKTLLAETIISVTYTAGWEKSPAARREGREREGEGERRPLQCPRTGQVAAIQTNEWPGTLRLLKSRDVCSELSFGIRCYIEEHRTQCAGSENQTVLMFGSDSQKRNPEQRRCHRPWLPT